MLHSLRFYASLFCRAIYLLVSSDFLIKLFLFNVIVSMCDELRGAIGTRINKLFWHFYKQTFIFDLLFCSWHLFICITRKIKVTKGWMPCNQRKSWCGSKHWECMIGVPENLGFCEELMMGCMCCQRACV